MLGRLRGHIVFEGILVIITGVMVITAFEYGERSRLIPLVAGIPTFLMLLTLFLADTVPALGARLRFVRAGGIVLDSASAPAGKEQTAGADASEGFSLRVWRMFLWLAFLVLLLRFVNYLIALPLFILLIMYVEARARLVTSILTAAGMGAFYFVLFRQVLQASF